MGSLIALLAIALISLIIVRVGSISLMMTGLNWDTASFQSYSAFFGVGFTTAEAEMVVNHPVRRRIIRDMILAGNLGVTSALATTIVTFVQPRDTLSVVQLVLMILGGGLVLVSITKIKWIRTVTDKLIRWSLRRAGVVRAMDYELLLRVRKGFCVSEIEILPENPLGGKTLRESRPSDRGIVILGIDRDGEEYHGAPGADDLIKIGDTLTVYGHEESISEFT